MTKRPLFCLVSLLFQIYCLIFDVFVVECALLCSGFGVFLCWNEFFQHHGVQNCVSHGIEVVRKIQPGERV